LFLSKAILEGRVSSQVVALPSRSSYPFVTDYSYDSLDRVIRPPGQSGEKSKLCTSPNCVRRLTTCGWECRRTYDYKVALQKLIRDLRARPTATGVVFGYFLDRPSQVLQRRLREVTRTLVQSGLPPTRYLVRPIVWNDEVSTFPPDKEPGYPSLFLVESTNPVHNARK
jgi:hypothetical protein